VPIYISLMKWTSQGIGGLPAWRDRMEEGERAIEERGGKLIDSYVTLGRFDVVEVFEAPDDETAYQCLVAAAKHENRAPRVVDDALGDAADQETPDWTEAAAAYHQEAGPQFLAQVQDGVYGGALQEVGLDEEVARFF